MLAMVASVWMFLPSCVMENVPDMGGDNEGEEVVPKPDGPSGEIMPDEQKVKLEDVALRLLDKCPTDDFKRYFELVERFKTVYLDNEDYDFSVLLDAVEESVDKVWTEEVKGIYDAATKEWIREEVTNLTIILSQHTGEFLFSDTGVKKTNSNSDVLKVKVPLDGNIYVAEFKQSGKTETAIYQYAYNWIYDGSQGYWDPQKDTWVDTYPDNVTEKMDMSSLFTIEVPESIEFTLVEDARAVAEIKMDFTKSFTVGGLDPSVDNFAVATTISLDNGYSIVSRKFKYDGSSEKAGFNLSLQKDGEALVSSVADGDVHMINTVKEYDNSGEGYVDAGSRTIIEVVRANNVDFVVDVLGEIQIRGNCPDFLEFNKAWDEWEDACYDAHFLKNDDKLNDAMAKVNSRIDIGVCYDNGSNRQAWIEFEWEFRVEEHDGWTSEKYAEYPVIVFEDGSRYAWKEYFTEEAFGKLFDAFESYSEGVSDLIGIIDDDNVLDVAPDSLATRDTMMTRQHIAK